MRSSRALLLILLCLTHSVVSGYELATHGRLTKQAFLKSFLLDESQLNETLGLYLDEDLSATYFDATTNELYMRSARDGFMLDKKARRFPALGEAGAINISENVYPYSPIGWLMRGAIREDDYIGRTAPNPRDDPYNTNDLILDNRPLHHFYDPRNDRGLRVFGVNIGDKAPDWAVGAKDVFNDENEADVNRRNHFTMFDARESMFRALTGRDGSGSVAIGVDGTTPVIASDKEAVRKAYWATTFRALGDLVHLIQDMAQPQHTRNDAHAGSEDYSAPSGLTGHKSYYEKYIDGRAKQSTAVASNGSTTALKPLNYGAYAIPTLNDYTSYFSVQHLQSNVMARTGIADYSNRGFFTVGKNLGQGDYDLPSNTIASYSPQPVVVDSQGHTVDVLYGSVFDAFTGATESDVPLTTWGLWNEPLKTYNSSGPEVFTLIQENYDAMADLLIPRAVAYSAGLIDYFFRGRLDIAPPDEGVYGIVDHAVANGANDGFTKIKLKLRNATPDIDDGQATYPQDIAAGTLRAVAKFHRNGCYQPDLSGQPGVTSCDLTANRTLVEEIVVSDSVTVSSLSATEFQDFSFDFTGNPIPMDATDLHLQVVYRGGLGAEADAVAVATLDISEPTYVTVSNYTDYYLLDGTFYEPQFILDTPALFARIDDDQDGQYNPVVDVDIDPITLNYSFNFGGPALGTASLPPARFCRIAVLVNNPGYTINIHKQTFGYWISPQLGTNVFQLNPATGEVDATGFGQSRGIYWQVNFPDWKWLGSTVDGDTSVLSDFANTTPVPIELNF